MGGSGGGAPPMRPEVNVKLAPSPTVSPVAQPDPGARTEYGQYYLPPSLEALRASLMASEAQGIPFGVRSPYRAVAPDSTYAAPRPPQIFRPSPKTPAPPMANPVESALMDQLKEMQDRLDAQEARLNPVYYGGGGN